MSTYWNPETGKYENFEMTVIQKMKNVADKLEEVAGDQIEVVAGIRYDTDEQGLTDAQQENARKNIDAVSSEELASGLGDLETEIGADVADLRGALLLEQDEIPDTVQSIAFDGGGNVQSIMHKKRTNQSETVRTDAFTFAGSTITEVRTLASGESLTIVTDTDTLVTTVTYAAA